MASKTIYWVYPGSLEKTLDRATWLEMAKELKAEGWDIKLISSDENQKWIFEQNQKGISIISFTKPNAYLVGILIYHLRVSFFLLKNIKNAQIIYFGHESAVILSPILLLKRVLRRKMPIFIFDTRTMPMSYSTNKLRFRAKYYLWVNKHGSLFSDFQTVITRRMADVLKIPLSKIVCFWSSGVNVEMFKESSRTRQWGSESDPLRLIYIGSLASERHIRELCQAIINIRTKGVDVTLDLFGDGPLKDEVIEFSKRMNSGIKYFSTVTPELIPQALAKSEVGVLPFPDEIQFRVSSPIKLFEYLASGLIILATRISCHMDILDKDEAIWAESAEVEDFEKALREAYLNRKRFSQMSINSLRKATGYSWKKSANNLSQGFYKAINNNL
jgi:glycosyltransferase involved in cell wall biosynthesis